MTAAVFRAQALAVTKRCGNALLRPLAATWSVRAELLTSGAALGGWAALTAGIASLLPLRARAVWYLSLGLLLLSLSGWRFLGMIGSRGLYVLTRSAKDGEGRDA